MSERLILVGVDGSEQSRRALSWAIAEAKPRGASVKLVTTWLTPDSGGGTAGRASTAEAAKEEATSRQETVVSQALAGLENPPPIRREVVRGEPVQVLCDESERAELIVLGSHGMSKLSNVMLGSVTLGCIRFAHCPVVVIPVPYPDDDDRWGGHRIGAARP